MRGKRKEKGVSVESLGNRCPGVQVSRVSLKTKKLVIGIDPGLSGALVGLKGSEIAWVDRMPLVVSGKNKEIDFEQLCHDFDLLPNDCHIFLERAVPFAMGTTSAFNYGRGFAMIEIAIRTHQLPVTYIEPAKWTKEMHAGTPADLKPKVRSEMAVRRLFPKLVRSILTNRNGKLHDGIVDALLIAAYGQRCLKMG